MTHEVAVDAAEAAAFGGTSHDEHVDRAVLHARLAEVIDGEWWAGCGPPVEVVTPRRTARSSSARIRPGERRVEIRLTDEQLSLATVAHELAHALAGVDHAHDDLFRSAYVDLVRTLGGPGAADALADAFAGQRLDLAPRRWPEPWRASGAGFVWR